jgi:hypothetical protein
MPGSKFYTLSVFIDEVKEYWYFGDFGKFKYNLGQSDKYLVEAKTLFEYKQYFLGSSALKNSNDYFQNVENNLELANRNGKNIKDKEVLYKQASLKHIEILTRLKKEIPRNFFWVPEKGTPTDLFLHKDIDDAISIRKNI